MGQTAGWARVDAMMAAASPAGAAAALRGRAERPLQATRIRVNR
jgi:hypothetical protein